MRIERDLHDGAQQRLVSLCVTLGVTRLDIPAGSPLATQLTAAEERLSAAHPTLEQTMTTVRKKAYAIRDGIALPIDRVAADQPYCSGRRSTTG
ncbi:histidine kinase [Streptomyces sp. SHP 1-2]|uniref:histidine kinase n=1 Tax=Streptomyces sp. SHP 1-2 TaxID=2769489 RepID=UPI0039E0CA35